MTVRQLTIVIATPRSFCAGVDRAISTVQLALSTPGARGTPVYMRHEIVHNRTVVDNLRAQGAEFVSEIAEVPDGALVIFSAHGVSPTVRAEAAARGLSTLDATCPLVARVHAEVRRHADHGATILLIGHPGHPEVEGVLGEAPDHTVLVSSTADAALVNVPDPARVAYCTQTTLSLDEFEPIVSILQARFPALVGPDRGNICYATQNRQDAVRTLIEQEGAQVVLVVGSPTSSNANRLREVAERAGARAYLLESAAALDAGWIAGKECVGVTAGASTPESLVQELVEALRQLGATHVRTVAGLTEDVICAPPPLPSRTGP